MIGGIIRGRYRWMVEPILASLYAFCRLGVRYERRPDVCHACIYFGYFA